MTAYEPPALMPAFPPRKRIRDTFATWFVRGAIGLAAAWMYVWTMLALWSVSH